MQQKLGNDGASWDDDENDELDIFDEVGSSDEVISI